MIFKKELTAEEFNPDVIMNSGQVFRMSKESKEKDNIPATYAAYSGDNDIVFFYNYETDTWDFACEENQWPFWLSYFDFGTDYVAYNSIIRKSNDKFLKDSLKDAFGMRILKQDLWETFVSYIISQNNNIPKIKKSINILCERYSDGIHFPSAKTLAFVPVEELALGTALGYRADYIHGLAKDVYEEKIDINAMSQLPYEKALEGLLSIKGIGPKVANCIMLYGFHFMESYPIDTWMKKIIKEDYAAFSSAEYMDYINHSYAGFQGYVQQIQFYHKRQK